MKVSYQIIHRYQEDPLKIITRLLHLVLQDDLYIQIDLRSTIDFIKINLNRVLHSSESLCFFEINIDETVYDISKYDELIQGFATRLTAQDGFIRLVKFIDEFRLQEYLRYYNEITEIEMKIREVFSYIFYNRYLTDEVDDLNEYVIRFPAETPKREDYIERLENPFFYFTFNGYKDFFQKPREIPFDIKDFKDLLNKIRNSDDFEKLKDILEVKGLTDLTHIDFILGVKEDLDSIEKLRNCVAHNRAATQKVVTSYLKSKTKLEQLINDFWKNEIEEVNSVFEINFAEQYSYNKLKELLEVSEYDDSNSKVIIGGTPSAEIGTFEEFKAYLLEIANNEAQAKFPNGEAEREPYLRLYNGQVLVDKVLNEYKKELIILGWV